LVGDLRGFSHLARRVDPEVAVGLLQAFYTTASDIAVAHRATIDRVVGDVFILLFQSTGARRDDGTRAIRTALGLQRAFLALRNCWEREGALRGGQLGLAMGVGSGQIILAELEGVPGVSSVPFGEPLSRATRLCQGARAADVLVDEETYAGARRTLERDVVFTSREVSQRGRDALTAYKAQLRKAGLRVVSRGSATDPVCGRDIALRPMHEWRDYGGATFHFCSPDCAERFSDDPANWLP
jgi:class 3 adenylate cyclase